VAWAKQTARAARRDDGFRCAQTAATGKPSMDVL